MSESDMEEESEEETPQVDKMSILQLPQKQLARASSQQRLEDLSVRQLGYCVAGVCNVCLPSDIIEIGGESVA